MYTQTTNHQLLQPAITRIIEIDQKLEKQFFAKNELSYLQQAQVQNFNAQIEKIYLAYAAKEKQSKIKQLREDILALLNEEDISVKDYALLDHSLKDELATLKKPVIMTSLDEARVIRFEERIEEIYSSCEPTYDELMSAEKLIEEKESLLTLI